MNKADTRQLSIKHTHFGEGMRFKPRQKVNELVPGGGEGK